MTSEIRLNGCKSRDIDRIVNFIVYRKYNNNQEVERAIQIHAKTKAEMLIDSYTLPYCKTIIKVHANNNIYDALKKVQGPIDFSSELKFYKQLILPYVVNIIYNKINASYQYAMLPHIIQTEKVECSICLCNIENTTHTMITKCNHYFHRNCFMKWNVVKRVPTCPNCRAVV